MGANDRMPVDCAALPMATLRTNLETPFRFQRETEFKAVMLEALAQEASDVFVQPGQPIVARINGQLRALTTRALDLGEIKDVLGWAVGRATAVTDIMSGNPCNGRYEVFDPVATTRTGDRVRHGYRVNGVPVMAVGGVGCQVVIRRIPNDPPTIADVKLDADLVKGMTPRDGIVIIAGATGQGKTTTFAALMRYILEGDTPIKGNLITAEEPIEFRFDGIPSSHSICVQSQVPEMAKSFSAFIREAMRRAPKLIMIGEMRDQETVMAAIEASLTGHPVFATAHATDVPSIARRLITRFPENERSTAIFDIIDTARVFMAQRLVRGQDGKLHPAREYLSFDEEIRAELSSLTQMGQVTQRLKHFVSSRGHSFAAEAERMLFEGIIDQRVADELAA
jgi:defect in organelle trafficking protein DotB